jgi:hypothetical protein
MLRTVLLIFLAARLGLYDRSKRYAWLDDLVQLKIHYIGISIRPPDASVIPQQTCEVGRPSPVVVRYSRVERTPQEETSSQPSHAANTLVDPAWALKWHITCKKPVAAALWDEVDERRLRIAQIVDDIAVEIAAQPPRRLTVRHPGGSDPVLGP